MRKMENKIEWKLNTVGSVHRIKSSGDVDIIKYISDDLSGGWNMLVIIIMLTTCSIK